MSLPAVVPQAAVIGGLLGLSMGLIGYGLASRVIEAWLDAAECDEDEPVAMTRDELERWAIGFRRMVLAGTVILFPLAGFLMGLAIGG
ncbi:hypothetical protein ACFFJ7_07905 [Pseudochelatococcus lubricantis]|uniref:hypothetical protein n=1 Tax=Pseudochelatococcus lubricantis TaxID=1538102 RepID=UPI0035EDC2C2